MAKTLDAFISHASVDREIAERAYAMLEERELHCFFSPRTIDGASDFQREIVEAIREASVILVLLSKASAQSRWVQWEVRVAADLAKVIIPARIEDFEPELENPIHPCIFYLQYTDLFPDFEEGMRQVLKVFDSEPAAPVGEQAIAPAKSEAPPAEWRGSRITGEEIIARLRDGTRRGDRRAAYLLGRCLADGVYVEADDRQAVRMFQLAAQGAPPDPQAVHALASMYRQGRGVGRDDAKMISLYEQAAGLGYLPSLYRLGRIYETGEGASRDLGRAYRRYLAAAQAGFAPAQFRVAELSLLGAGVTVNHANALTYAQQAAAQHFGPALNLMGRLYRKGVGVPQDDAAACVWYERAIAQGEPAGAWNLASMYERGLGVEKDPARAHELREVWTLLREGRSPGEAAEGEEGGHDVDG